MEREKLGSRLGFILLSAGCAIGIGNVWRFPYVAGEYGGGAFVLFYILFLVAFGVPVMTMEFAVGRASRQSAVKSFQVLEKKGNKWHFHGAIAFAGNLLLMMFYTTVAGWMLHYFYLSVTGGYMGMDPQGVAEVFGTLLGDWKGMLFWMALVVVIGMGICAVGLQNGVERITKWMMGALIVIMVVLALHSVLMEGGAEGLRFYLIPDFGRMMEKGIVATLVAAMNQAFFTLSLGIGAMAIFGSYIEKSHSLFGEAVRIAGLDTFVAVTAGLIIFPACFAYGVSPDSGPNLIFITLPNLFANMAGGRIWGSLFFLFMSFAALSTVLAVFENIMSMTMELTGLNRKRMSVVNMILIFLLSVPCVLGFNVWSGFQPFGEGTGVLDLEDFLVSNLILPLGSLVYLLFCVSRYGWGFDQYINEVNEGEGLKMPAVMRGYLTWVLPVVVAFIFIQGLIGFFS